MAKKKDRWLVLSYLLYRAGTESYLEIRDLPIAGKSRKRLRERIQDMVWDNFPGWVLTDINFEEMEWSREDD